MKVFTTTAAVLVIFTTVASAVDPTGHFKSFGKQWAWNNIWNDPNQSMKAAFLPGKQATMNVTFKYNNNDIHAYPAIIRGSHYNVKQTNDTCFPRQISKITSIPVKFSYKCGGTNLAGDFAYDLFFRADQQATTPELEVMIWGDHNSIPIGSKTGNAVIKGDGRTFDLYEGMNNGAGYFVYSFVPTGTVKSSVGSFPLPTSGHLNIDVMTFINWLLKNRTGHLTRNSYLHTIEIGYEAGNGNGWACITGDIDCKDCK